MKYTELPVQTHIVFV